MNEAELAVMDEIELNRGLPAVEAAIIGLKEYRRKIYYASKTSRLEAWDADQDLSLYELVISVWTVVLQHEPITIQAACGRLNHKILLDDTVDRVKIIAEVIAVISKSGLIDITKRDNASILLTSGYELSIDLPEEDKHKLMLTRPQVVTSNYDEEYGSMLLGDKMNFHEEEICLDHLNRMNQIPICLNREFICKYPETTKKVWDTPDQQEQWDKFVWDSKLKYAEFISQGNKGYLMHKYDTRGRSYCCGYHINSQGAGYKKACIQLYNKELVEV